jgi:hypothetical protein
MPCNYHGFDLMLIPAEQQDVQQHTFIASKPAAAAMISCVQEDL